MCSTLREGTGEAWPTQFLGGAAKVGGGGTPTEGQNPVLEHSSFLCNFVSEHFFFRVLLSDISSALCIKSLQNKLAYLATLVN